MNLAAPVLTGLDTGPQQAPVLVLGLGNILMQDEGVGVAVVERLQQQYRCPEEVDLLDGGTSGMALLDDLRRREHLIVVDAVHTGQPAGTLVTLKGNAVPAFFRSRISPHQLALSDVLAVLTLTGEQPANISVIGIEPLSLDTRLGLSATVAEHLPELLTRVLGELAALGYAAEALPPSHRHAGLIFESGGLTT